jgi:hypothetical protein
MKTISDNIFGYLESLNNVLEAIIWGAVLVGGLALIGAIVYWIVVKMDRVKIGKIEAEDNNAIKNDNKN